MLTIQNASPSLLRVVCSWSWQDDIVTVLRYFRPNRKSDLKDRGCDGESNKAFPLTPSLSLEERVNVRMLRQGSGNVGYDPTHRSSAPRLPDQHLHDRTPWRTQPFQTSRVVLPLPWGEGWGEGEGISLSFTAFFSAVGSGLNSTENSEEPYRSGHTVVPWSVSA